MLDPLSLLPFALAARGGAIDGLGAGPLVAAGTTLLQRCAPLVRTLAAGRTALLLPDGPAILFALAASDGRGALLLDPLSDPADWPTQLSVAQVTAVFTTAALAPRVAHGRALVLVDAVPQSATVVLPDRELTVDLGSHHGLSLEGDAETPGRDEECVVQFEPDAAGAPRPVAYSHRTLLRAAQLEVARFTPAPDGDVTVASSWSTISGLTSACAALLAGARLRSETRP